MRYFLIAGEASGDLHAAALIQEIKKADAEAQFCFLGGDLMAAASGEQPVIHYRDMAYMGFVEVARHLRSILCNIKAARKAIDGFAPDRLILIDYPSFNLKMAAYAKRRGIRVAYYISPKVWAWKSWRVKKIKRVVDQMLAIFPFEVEFYAKRGYKVEYVGNPSVEEIDKLKAQAPERQEFAKRNGLPDKPLVALLPGSRLAEIRANLPLMAQAVDRCPQYRGVVAGAPGIDPEVYKQYTSLPVVFGQTSDLLAVSRAAVVTSGTATLEAALIGTPQVAVYRNNGSKLAYKIMEKVLKVKFVTLPNLICGRAIIPELLLHLCTADSIFDHLAAILPDRDARQQQIDDYAAMRAILGQQHAARAAAHAILANGE